MRICALTADSSFPKQLANHDIDLSTDSLNMQSALGRIRTITDNPRLSRRLSRLAKSASHSDWYVILADEALGVADYMEDLNLAYISNGDLNLMFFNRAFFSTETAMKKILSWGIRARIEKHRQLANKCDILLGNSLFTKQLMSFLYSIPFSGIVYPPVDVDMFLPRPQPGVDRYAVAYVRNEREQNLQLLETLASRIELKVVGGGRIPKSTNLGIVPDSELVRILSAAQVLAFPPAAEPFGYPVLEGMSCGTPAVAFDNGGPLELIDSDRNGWLVSTKDDFVRAVESAVGEGPSESMRDSARKKAARFSIQEMSKRLLSYLH